VYAGRAALVGWIAASACGWSDPAVQPVDAAPIPIDAGLTCASHATCDEVVSASEPASAFSDRLTTPGAVVCLESGVVITGQVRVGADDVTIAGNGEPMPSLVSDQLQTISLGAHKGVALVCLAIENVGPAEATALSLDELGQGRLSASRLSCASERCIAAFGGHLAWLAIRETAIETSAAAGNPGSAVHASRETHVVITDSTITAQATALSAQSGSVIEVTDSQVTSLDTGQAAGAVEIRDTSMFFLTSSTLRTAGYPAVAAGGELSDQIVLDGSRIQKAAGLPAGGVSPLVSGIADNTFDSSAPNTFCNEGTSTADGAFELPLISGPYDAAMSTFDDQAQVGPVDCDTLRR